MNKREVGKIKAGFIMIGGFVSALQLHKWGFGWYFSPILGFGFITILWLSLVWTIKSIFRE